MSYDCPACGLSTEMLHEGYCEECQEDRQRSLDEHNFRFDWWENLTATQREHRIKEAIR